jgi:hypothetical protein
LTYFGPIGRELATNVKNSFIASDCMQTYAEQRNEIPALSQNSVFLANRRWPVEVRARVCVKLASAMQPIKVVPGKWLGKGNYR